MPERPATPTDLGALERWMQAVVTDPDGPAAGAAGAEGRRALGAALEDVFLPSRELTVAERVGVYADGYFERLGDVLRGEFAGLVALLGSEESARLFRAYVVRHPSRHYSLNALGARFPAFLADEAECAAHAFAVELARLERSIQDVFDAPECASLGADDIAAVPAERWAGARLVPIPALALHVFAYPVNAWYRAFREDELRPAPAPAETRVLVHRHEGRVWRTDLPRPQHALLAALAAGHTLGEALGALAELPALDLAEVAPRVQGWFREWAGEGLFARVEG